MANKNNISVNILFWSLAATIKAKEIPYHFSPIFSGIPATNSGSVDRPIFAKISLLEIAEIDNFIYPGCIVNSKQTSKMHIAWPYEN